MNKACTVTVYAFNDLKAAPIWYESFEVTEGYNQESFVIENLILSRLNNTYKGGVIFFCY
jgi:hypothetical protein